MSDYLLPSQRFVLHPRSTVLLMRDCDGCNGTGDVYMAYCRACGKQIEESELRAELKNATKFMSCGHEWEKLCECHACGECDGKGYIQAAVPLSEILKLANAETCKPSTEDRG